VDPIGNGNVKVGNSRSRADAPIAVVIPVYNRRLKLINTLESVVAQRNAPALLIVVDDGSSDGTAEFAENWLSRNAPFEWKVIRQTNAGAAAARNRGFAEIDELPFVCFLDSDDLWPPEFLAEGLRGLEKRKDAVAAVADRVKEVAGRQKRVEDFSHLAADPILWLMCRDAGILSCSVIRSGAARTAGLFVPGMVACEDSDFLLRLFLSGPVVRSEASPVRYIKKAPLEPTEAPNLTSALPDLPYLWARYWEIAFRRLRKHLPEEHSILIQTALARRWVRSALSCRQRKQLGRTIVSLAHALWWDHQWRRRLQLLWSFCCGNEKVFLSFKVKLPTED
jgi:glycosyltransferase involved in cell wall biosynthesis